MPAYSKGHARAGVAISGIFSNALHFQKKETCAFLQSSVSGAVLENMLYPRPAISSLRISSRSPLALTAYGVSYEFACLQGGGDGLWHGCRRGSFWLTPSKEERGSGDWGGDLVIYSTQAHVHPCRVLCSIASVATVT